MKPYIGDIIEIPLENGRFAYAQYVFFDKQMGPLIQVFNTIRDLPLSSLDILDQALPLFPPIITGLQAALRVGIWKIIGKKNDVKFVYPKFVSTLYNSNTGKPGNWYLYDGEKDIPLGSRVPDEYKSLEFLFVWSPQTVATRIMTGKYPSPYRQLIENNEFTPRSF